MSQPPARTPRTMGKLVPPAEPARPDGPTPPRMPRVMVSQPVANAVAAPVWPVTPRPMPGQVRMGVKVRKEDLAQRFPEQSDKTLAEVVVFLGAIVASTLDWAQAQSLGLGLQQRYGELVQGLLDCASADVVRTAPQHLSRLITLLEVCAEDFSPASGLGQWLRKDKARAIGQHAQEIDLLKGRLSKVVLELEAPMAEVMAIRNRLATLADELMVAGLACDWLFDDARIDDEVRAVLAERALAMTRTAGLVRQQQSQSTATANHLDALRDRIQEGVLIALPTWLAHLATLPPALNDTQRFVVRDDLAQIIHRLKA